MNGAATPTAAGYTRLADDDEAPEVRSEAAQLLEPLFLKLRERLAATSSQRPAGSGIVVALSVGSGDAREGWLVDARENTRPEDTIIKIETIATTHQSARPVPTLSLHVPAPSDLVALLERRLPPFRALAQRRIVLTGDIGALRSMSWLVGTSDRADDGAGSILRVGVLGAEASRGYGAYTLQVEEGAVAWIVTRRWSELKAMHAQLVLLCTRLPTFPMPSALPSS